MDNTARFITSGLSGVLKTAGTRSLPTALPSRSKILVVALPIIIPAATLTRHLLFLVVLQESVLEISLDNEAV